MNDTPRTDHASVNTDAFDGPKQAITFARQLEKELAKVTAQRDALVDRVHRLLHYMEAARKGDCPLIHHTIITSLDLEMATMKQTLATMKGDAK